MSEETLALINRFKAYLAHDQYNRDKRTMMDGYLMARMFGFLAWLIWSMFI